MTAADPLKNIDNKINVNQAQYDVDRLATKIFAYYSGDLTKCKYWSGEDLGYKSKCTWTSQTWLFSIEQSFW